MFLDSYVNLKGGSMAKNANLTQTEICAEDQSILTSLRSD